MRDGGLRASQVADLGTQAGLTTELTDIDAGFFRVYRLTVAA